MSDLDLIRTAAHEAGTLAVGMRDDSEFKAWSKAGGSPVSDADLALDRLLREQLGKARPDYGWLSEETVDDRSRLRTRRAFVVDPIDGTRAYLKRKPHWSVSIAVVEDGLPVAGVLYVPEMDQTYEAEAGQGATLNGKPIRVSGRTSLEGCAILADAPTVRRPGWPRPWPEMRIETRNSAALRMALVAAGTFDAVMALSSKCDWDLAAADLIVREAGGLATDHRGRPFAYNKPTARKPSLICAPPELHRLILERLGHIELP